MWMEFQGKKATHDFLSLCNKDSSFQLQDSRPTSQGFYLKTHDFLKPLEKAEEPDPARRAGPKDRAAAAVAHVLPGGIGTYSISHVAENGSSTAVKPELFICARGPVPEPDSGNAEHEQHAGVAFTLPAAAADAADAAAVSKDIGIRGLWPSPSASRATASFGALASSRNHPAHDRKRFMESGSRSSMGFDEEDEDDEEFGKREGTSNKVEFTVKVDGNGGNDQKPTTSRSKHSATEQRRRSKINDRFQILRELIPHGDQKRDKASFLLEVIEYIRFLQEKVQKYECSYPGWSDENAKLMPWVNVYFRSFWENARNISQVTVDVTDEPSQAIKTGCTPGFMCAVNDKGVLCAPQMVSTDQNPLESDMSAGVSYKALESKASSAHMPLQPNYVSVERGAGAAQDQQRLISDIDNMAARCQSQWLRPSGPADNSRTLNEQDELTVDEGTVSASAAYSHNIVNTLNQALESSGVDMSQANISVQINLGKRATRRATPTTMCSAKDIDDPLSGSQPVIGHSRVGSSGGESEQAPKRHKSEKC